MWDDNCLRFIALQDTYICSCCPSCAGVSLACAKWQHSIVAAVCVQILALCILHNDSENYYIVMIMMMTQNSIHTDDKLATIYYVSIFNRRLPSPPLKSEIKLMSAKMSAICKSKTTTQSSAYNVITTSRWFSFSSSKMIGGVILTMSVLLYRQSSSVVSMHQSLHHVSYSFVHCAQLPMDNTTNICLQFLLA